MSDWTRERVLARIAADFSAEQYDDVLLALDEYAGDTPSGRARVQLAILEAAAGDLVKVRAYVDHAKIDFRDVLYWVEHVDEGESP